MKNRIFDNDRSHPELKNLRDSDQQLLDNKSFVPSQGRGRGVEQDKGNELRAGWRWCGELKVATLLQISVHRDDGPPACRHEPIYGQPDARSYCLGFLSLWHFDDRPQ
jgi:hypothetical protein